MKNRTALFTTVYPGVLPYLREWYQSVKNQSDQNFDLWIVSDCLSQEGVFESTGEEFYANWYHAAEGESPATIRIHALSGIVEHYETIILVDSDDILLPWRVEQSKRGMEKSDMSACALDLINENGTPLYITAGGNFTFTDSSLFDFLLYRNIFGFSNTAFRATLLSQLLQTSSKCPALDWNFATRSTVMGARIHFDNLPGMMYRQHESNIARILPPFDKEILVCQIKCNAFGHPDEACLKKLPEEFSSQDTFAVYR